MDCGIEAQIYADFEKARAGEPLPPRYKTEYCVRCGYVARSWCGHVHGEDGRSIAAGWCDEPHPARAGDLDGLACQGQWQPEHGQIASE